MNFKLIAVRQNSKKKMISLNYREMI